MVPEMKVGVEPGVIEGVCLPKSLLRLAGVQSSWPGQKASMGSRKLGRRVPRAGEIGRHGRWRHFGVRRPRLCRDITCRAVLPPSVAVSLSLSPSVAPSSPCPVLSRCHARRLSVSPLTYTCLALTPNDWQTPTQRPRSRQAGGSVALWPTWDLSLRAGG